MFLYKVEFYINILCLVIVFVISTIENRPVIVIGLVTGRSISAKNFIIYNI